MNNLIIITGASKGIGKALAKRYLKKNYKVYTLSRSAFSEGNSIHTAVDLSNPEEASHYFENLLNTVISKEKINSITLINNAGRLGKIGNLEKLEAIDIAKTIQLNTITPLIMSSLFIQKTKKLNCKKQLITISSGAAQTPYQGWSVYCASKAAVDMMTRTLAKEQDLLTNSVKCVAIYPGVVDTNMQNLIRKTSKEDFYHVQRFINLKKEKQLYTPEFVADTIFTMDTENYLKNGDLIDIRNYNSL